VLWRAVSVRCLPYTAQAQIRCITTGYAIHRAVCGYKTDSPINKIP